MNNRAAAIAAIQLCALAFFALPLYAAPDIVRDGSIKPGAGDVEYDSVTRTWDIHEDLGQYNSKNTSLYHSFSRFNVKRFDTAEFSATKSSLARIFARVTGGEMSDCLRCQF